MSFLLARAGGGVALVTDAPQVEAWGYILIGETNCAPQSSSFRLAGGHLCFRVRLQTTVTEFSFAVEPLSMYAFQHLDGIGCHVTLACGGGGSPTDFIDRLMPAAAARLQDSRFQRCC